MSRPVLRTALICLCSLALAALGWLVLAPLMIAGSPSTLFAGDYSLEADTPLALAMQGHIFRMWDFAQPPLMMPLALLARLPALVIAELLGIVSSHPVASAVAPDGSLDPIPVYRYAVGTISIAAIAAAAAAITAERLRRGTRLALISALLAAATLVLNPLALQAMIWGHPEEVLLAGLILASLLSAARGSWVAAAVLLGLACATKQPALLVVPALLLAAPPGRRLRSLIWLVATAAAVTLPFVILDFGAFFDYNLRAGSALNAYRDVKPFNFYDFVGLEQLDETGRLVIFATAIGLPLGISWRRRWRAIGAEQLCLVVACVLLVRCYFDPVNISYYALPAVAALIGWELVAARSSKLLSWLRERGLPYLPVVSLPVAVFLEAITGGAITIWAEHYLSGKDRMLYGLGAGVVLLCLVLAALGIRVKLDRSRALLYGAAAVAVAAILAAVPILYTPRADEQIVTAPSFGYVSVPRDELARRAAPQRVFELDSPPSGTSLRFAAAPAAGKWKSSDVLGMLDYGPDEDASAGLTVTTYGSGDFTEGVSDDIKLCRADPDCRPDPDSPTTSADVVATEIGPALLYESFDTSLEAKVITKGGQMVYLIASGPDQRDYILAAVERLQPIAR